MNGLFVKALKKKFEMTQEDATSLAKTVEEIFNGEKEVEDMTIDKHARSLFYELHRENFLKLRREEYKEKGKFMRKYFWSFDNDTIKEEAYRKSIVEEDPYKIYQKIPRNAWLIRSYNT
jgi:hypothetical protein